MNKKLRLVSVEIRSEQDGDVTTEHLDEKELQAYEDGDFTFIGIYAVAQLLDSNNMIQHVHSGGMWGIDERSDEKYMEQIKLEELADLEQTLMKDFHFTKKEIEAVTEI